MYVLGIKRVTGNQVVVLASSIEINQRATANVESVYSPPALPVELTYNTIVWLANAFAISDIGGVHVTTSNGYGAEETYELYAKIHGTDNGVLIGTVDATTLQNNGFNIPLMADLTTLITLSNQTTTLTQAQHDAITTAYNTAQETLIFSLPYAQQVIFATGTDAEKQAVIDSLTPEQQAVFTGTPAQFVRTPEEIAADKLSLERITNKLLNGEFVSNDDSVFLALGNSLMAEAAMNAIDSGQGYNGLRTIGLTKAQALRVLSFCHLILETTAYESEVKLKLLENDPSLLPSLKAFIYSETGQSLPPMTAYISQLRANSTVYEKIRNWTPQ